MHESYLLVRSVISRADRDDQKRTSPFGRYTYHRSQLTGVTVILARNHMPGDRTFTLPFGRPKRRFRMTSSVNRTSHFPGRASDPSASDWNRTSNRKGCNQHYNPPVESGSDPVSYSREWNHSRVAVSFRWPMGMMALCCADDYTCHPK